jgi:anti-anti-sigma regulatory factor
MSNKSMGLHIRIEGRLVVLSNVGNLLNDPAHTDAAFQIRDLLEQGYRAFILELNDLHEIGKVLPGLLVTWTRQIRQAKGEIVLVSRADRFQKYLEGMRLDDYWDTFRTVPEAAAFLAPPSSDPARGGHAP